MDRETMRLIAEKAEAWAFAQDEEEAERLDEEMALRFGARSEEGQAYAALGDLRLWCVWTTIEQAIALLEEGGVDKAYDEAVGLA